MTREQKAENALQNLQSFRSLKRGMTINLLMQCDLFSILGISICRGDLNKMETDKLDELLKVFHIANDARTQAKTLVIN